MRTSPTTGALMPEHGFSKYTRLPVGDVYRSHDGLQVISSLDDMELPGSDGLVGPTWLVSVTRYGERPTDGDLRRVIEAFDMPAFEEDNHFPGASRALFCPLDERYRVECECKLTETVVVEPDGYRWTTPSDGPCRGCELSHLVRSNRLPARPCPIHEPTGATA